jgi:SAM-dependent methyltransferase
MIARCELCGSERNHSLFAGRDWLYGQAVQSEVLQCDACGLAYLWPQPVRPLDNYPPDYAPHVGRRDSTDIAHSTGHRGGLLRKAKVACKYGQGPLLDIGCAASEFLAVVHSLGERPVWGMDLSERALQHARGHLGMNVWVGDVPRLPLPNESVGVVTLWHVLEHLPHPLAALRDISRVLRPDGVLILACPMVDSWEAKVFGRYWAGYDVPRHLFAYSHQTLHRTLRHAGFEASEVPNVVWGYNSAKISSAFWLQRFSLFRLNPRLLRKAAALLGAATAMTFALLSGILRNRRTVAVFVARKRRRAG